MEYIFFIFHIFYQKSWYNWKECKNRKCKIQFLNREFHFSRKSNLEIHWVRDHFFHIEFYRKNRSITDKNFKMNQKKVKFLDILFSKKWNLKLYWIRVHLYHNLFLFIPLFFFIKLYLLFINNIKILIK